MLMMHSSSRSTRRHANDLSLETETTTTATLLNSVLHFTV